MLTTNLLQKALKLIPPVSFQYEKFIIETVNTMGIKVPTYAEAVEIKGSVQSPENSLYEQMGLSLEKNYKIFYGSIDIKGNEAQSQPDRFIYDGKVFETVKNTNWFNYDGWCGVLAVEIKQLRNTSTTTTTTTETSEQTNGN